MRRSTFIILALLILGTVLRIEISKAAVPSSVKHASLIAEVEAEDENDDVFEPQDEDVRPAPTKQVTPQISAPPQNTNARVVTPQDTVVPEVVVPQVTVPAPIEQAVPVIEADVNVNANMDVRALPVSQRPFPWAWIVTRAAGIASFLTLALLSIVGMLLTTGALFRIMSPATAWSLHRAIATALLFSVATHIVGILLDTFMNLHVFDVFIPFYSSYRPLLIALGIFGFYILLLQLATSLYTMTKYPRFWRTVHALSFVMFALIFLHGVLIGTDSKQWWALAMYWASGIAVGATVAYRLMWRYKRVA